MRVEWGRAPGGGGEPGGRSMDRGGAHARRSSLIWVLATLVLAETAALAVIAVRARWLAAAESSQQRRGERVAERMGCFGCHGPGGAGGIPGPGSRAGDVPAWVGGSWTMSTHEPGDVRSWILDGPPPGQKPDAGALIKMPAFRSRMSGAELADLPVSALTVSQFGELPDSKVSAGRDAALRFGCFGCHGAEGRGLVRDPGSLKGYVPSWDGDDYAELVRGDDELRQWVRNGAPDRLRANPAARHFLEGEAVQMPAYGDRVKPAEL